MSEHTPTKVSAVVYWGDDDEPHVWVPATDEDTSGERIFAVEVPTVVADRFAKAGEEWDAAHRAALDAAGVDIDACRLRECCPRWEGYVSPERAYWAVTLSASGDEHTWPLMDHMVTSFKTKAEADEHVARLPDEFYIHWGGWPLTLVTRDRLSVQRGVFRSRTSSCNRCGWEREEHAHAGEEKR